jgi:hypothetical protein
MAFLGLFPTKEHSKNRLIQHYAHQIVAINNTSNGAILGLFHGFASNYKEKKHNEISACRR